LFLVGFGFVAFQRRIWGLALIIFLFTPFLNTLLKYLFHVPLMSHLGKGFAFPSGHMQASFAFYGWLIISYRNFLLRSLLSIILMGIGFSLIYFHYHILIDILGALGFGSLVLIMYYYAAKIPLIYKRPSWMGFMLWGLAMPILLFLKHKSFIPTHLWQAFYGLLGFSLAWELSFFPKRKRRYSKS
jgi:undecaprenyl-diphosphatase